MVHDVYSTKHSQVSLEYLVVFGIILLIAVPIFYYSLHESSNQIRMNQAEDAANSLAKAADSVYALGPGSRDYVVITLPTGISGSSVKESEIILRIDIFGSQSDIIATAHAAMTGMLPTAAGTYHIPVEMLESGIVRVGEGNDTFPPIIVYTYPRGRISFNDITIKANTNEPALCKYDDDDKTYGTMQYDLPGSLMSHEDYMGVLSEGNHIYYARCIDGSGNPMLNSSIINFTINTTIITANLTGNLSNGTNQTVELDPPVITLVAPADGYTDTDGVVLFQYNVADASVVAFCELIMNNSVIYTATGISKDTTNNLTKGGLDYGHYGWSINCTDQYGNEGSSASRGIFINYIQDYDLPVVHLMSPADNTIRDYWLIRFMYNTTDNTSAIDHCTLHMNGVLDTGGEISWNVVDSIVAEGAAESMTLPLFRANYTWQISCTDTSYNANEGFSETRKLRVNITAGEEAFIDSCAGWCGVQGLSNGRCDNSEQKCEDNCGLPYSSSHDCYAGISVSLQYCIAGQESKACCCII